MKIIYEALHNPMIEESAPYTISIHESREGAEKAISDHKLQCKLEYENDCKMYLTSDLSLPYKTFEDWCKLRDWYVLDTELLP